MLIVTNRSLFVLTKISDNLNIFKNVLLLYVGVTAKKSEKNLLL
jgi:hypothetical protein